MKRFCCFCEKFFGEKEPLDDPSETTWICPDCLPQVLKDIEKEVSDFSHLKP